jgi:signal transduction histidine kinase
LLVKQYNKIKYKKQLEALELQKKLQQERSRISRDLHDNIGAYTSALIAGINQLKNEEGRKEENISELNDYASNIMGYLRETIWVLNNQHLTFTAFSDRFKNYAGRIVKNYPQLRLQFHEKIENERELSPQISLNLFRVMQEALQNACKHADASAIEINFSSDQKIELSVVDNGKGIGNTKRDDSYGMANMQERANEIGFSFTIESGSGTKVMLTES